MAKPRAAELAEERPAWLDGAVVYGVVPFLFGPRGFDDVTARLDAIKELGAPRVLVALADHRHRGGRLRLRRDRSLRAARRLRDGAGPAELIAAAHVRGLRVIMDFVPNHTSEQHPYHLSAAQRGPASPYYDFYDRDAAGEVDDVLRLERTSRT